MGKKMALIAIGAPQCRQVNVGVIRSV